MVDPVRMVGLWERKDKNDITYLSDKQHGTSSILVMPNTLKKKSEEPDYFLYIKPEKEKQSGENPKEPDKEERGEEIPEEPPSKGKTSFMRKFLKDFFEIDY